MVKVKRGGKWVNVKPGESVGRVSVPTSSKPSTPKPSGTITSRVISDTSQSGRSVQIQGDTVKIDGQGFSVAPSLQEEFIRRQTGGSGTSARQAISQARSTENLRQAQVKADIQNQKTREALRLPETGPTREVLQRLVRQARQARQPSVEVAPRKTLLERIKESPGKVIETVTDKKPREILRQLIGGQKDVTQPVTTGEVVVETLTIPKKVTLIGGGLGSKLVGPLFPEEGFKVKTPATPETQTTFFEPQFGTVTQEAPEGIIERTINIPARGERVTRIFERKRVEEGVIAGTQLGAFLAAPIVFAPGQVAEGTQTALDPKKTTTERVLGGVEAALGATIIGGKAVRIGRTKIVTKTPEPIPTPQAIVVTKTLPIKGKPTPVSVFELRGQVSPRIRVEETTRFRQGLDFLGSRLEKVVQVGRKPAVNLRAKPKVSFIEPKIFSIRTPEPIIGEAPFITSTVIQGSRTATISKVVGKTIPTKVKEFAGLSELEKGLWKRVAEEVAGRPVALKNVPGVLGLVKERTISEITSKQLLKLTPKKGFIEVELIPKGSRTQRAIVAEGSKKTFTGDRIDLFESTSIGKDVTLPGKLIKRFDRVDSTVIKIKPKPSPEDAIEFISPEQITKTPLSQAFKPQVISQIPTPKVRIPKPSKTILEPTKTILEPTKTPIEIALPRIVGGSGKIDSTFAGQGSYELSEGQISFRGTSLVGIETSKDLTLPKISMGTRSDISPKVSITPKIDNLLGLDIGQEGGTRQSQKQPQDIKSNQKSGQETITQPQLDLTQITQTIQTPKPPKPRPPRIKPPTPPKFILPPVKDTPAKKALKKVTSIMKGEFEVFAREKGKDVSIGKVKTKKEAKTLLTKKLKKTIAASGFIEEGGVKLSAIETGLVDGEFRVSKEDLFRVVQKKGRRLGTKQETSQIQFFKSSKGGGNLFGPSNRGKKNSSFF